MATLCTNIQHCVDLKLIFLYFLSFTCPKLPIFQINIIINTGFLLFVFLFIHGSMFYTCFIKMVLFPFTLQLVVACVVSLAASNPQFFPISNLRQYLEHKQRQATLRELSFDGHPGGSRSGTGRSGTTLGPREVYLQPSRPVTHPEYRIPTQLVTTKPQPSYPSTVFPKATLNPQTPEQSAVDRVGYPTKIDKSNEDNFPVADYDVTSRPVYPKKYVPYQSPPPRKEKPVYVEDDGITKRKLSAKKPSEYNREVPPYKTQNHDHYPFQFTKHAEIPDERYPIGELPVPTRSDSDRRQYTSPERFQPTPTTPRSHPHPPSSSQPSPPSLQPKPPSATPTTKQDIQWKPSGSPHNHPAAATNPRPQIHDLVAKTYGDRRVRQVSSLFLCPKVIKELF